MITPAPVHYIRLYEKPALGTSFLQSFEVINYRHSINAIGGFDTATCDIAIRSREDGQQFLDQYIGNRVAFYVDNPVEPIWEGFINRMTFAVGGVEYSIGLDEMANRLSTISTVGGASTSTAVVNDTGSQAVYGVKEDKVDLGNQTTAGTITTVLRDTHLAQRAWPKTSMIPTSGGSGLVHLECLGFWHTLNWEVRADATSALVAFNTLITTLLLPNLANGTTFFNNADFTDISANAATINRQKTRGQTFAEILMEVQEAGDATDYWVVGITPTGFRSGTRRLYYRLASTDVTYMAQQEDGLRVRNLYGQIVDPWTVRPDTGIRVSDMLIGWNGAGDNPTETYIKKIDYDANRQRAIYSGDDDLSAEGVFNLKRYNKTYGKRFGAGRRIL